MSAEYYAGKWNDHDIVLVTNAATDGKVQLRFDGEVIADGTTIFHMDRGITGKTPIDPELSIHVKIDGNGCLCIVGKPLKSAYDKATKVYFAEYDNHKLEAYTKKLNYSFIIDGDEADKKGGVLTTCAILGSQADKNGKHMMAVFSPSGLKDTCEFFVDAENVRMHPCRRQGGELIPLTPLDSDDGFMLGFMLGMSI